MSNDIYETNDAAVNQSNTPQPINQPINQPNTPQPINHTHTTKTHRRRDKAVVCYAFGVVRTVQA
jgi:hypothetical protein